MEIVVNDTNILIDLYNAGLLSYCKLLTLEFRTLDLILNEIEHKDQRNAVQQMIDEGSLGVYSLSESQMESVVSLYADYQNICNLSFVDVSVMTYAKENCFRLLTGDKKLRERAKLENVDVSGILFVIDMFINEAILDKGELIVALERLLQSYVRLPRKLIHERLLKLKSSP